MDGCFGLIVGARASLVGAPPQGPNPGLPWSHSPSADHDMRRRESTGSFSTSPVDISTYLALRSTRHYGPCTPYSVLRIITGYRLLSSLLSRSWVARGWPASSEAGRPPTRRPCFETKATRCRRVLRLLLVLSFGLATGHLASASLRYYCVHTSPPTANVRSILHMGYLHT